MVNEYPEKPFTNRYQSIRSCPQMKRLKDPAASKESSCCAFPMDQLQDQRLHMTVRGCSLAACHSQVPNRQQGKIKCS